MITVSAVLHVYGRAFSPNDAQRALGYILDGDKEEPRVGEHDKSPAGGSFLANYAWDQAAEPCFEGGSADLIPASLPIFQEKDLISTLRKCGAEEITLYVSVAYVGQCNVELSPTLLAALAGVGVALAITCYDDES